MDCPYIIRENIGFGRVREHGYYQLDEMAYDLTHDFANADVEVITRADKPIVPWYRPAEASQQYVDAIGPCVTPSNRNFTVVVLYDYEPAWVGSFHGEDVAFDFFERRIKNKRTVMLYKGNRLVCRAFNGIEEAQQ